MEYIGDFPTDDRARNMSGEKSTMHGQGFIYVKILPLRVLPPSPPEK